MKTTIVGIKATEIDWCVDIDDIPFHYDNEEEHEEEIEAAIEEIESGLPNEEFIPFVNDDIDEICQKVSTIADILSDKYGFLVNAFNYHLIGEDGNEYEILNTKWR